MYLFLWRYKAVKDRSLLTEPEIFTKVGIPHSSRVKFIATCSYSINEYKHMMKAQVFSTWMAFGGNTRDLGSFGEETDEITDLHQILEEVLLTEHGDGVASIKRRRRDLFSDGVWNLETASGRGRLKEDLESST
ncbi:hypothetical protein Tco_0924014 [Tanacetum coccineum]|uniref:Uncharacterized protein n=1 Tax=Tanacetum coccineum TaxID=301880 RepID=A0ABQ5D3Z8_9ASTR